MLLWCEHLVHLQLRSTVSQKDFGILSAINTVVLSYQNDGLTSIKFSLEKTLELMAEFHRHQPKRFGKSNYSKDSKIRKTIVWFNPNLDKSKNMYSILWNLIICNKNQESNKYKLGQSNSAKV